jgi:hypothetical protein
MKKIDEIQHNLIELMRDLENDFKKKSKFIYDFSEKKVLKGLIPKKQHYFNYVLLNEGYKYEFNDPNSNYSYVLTSTTNDEFIFPLVRIISYIEKYTQQLIEIWLEQLIISDEKLFSNLKNEKILIESYPIDLISVRNNMIIFVIYKTYGSSTYILGDLSYNQQIYIVEKIQELLKTYAS